MKKPFLILIAVLAIYALAEKAPKLFSTRAIEGSDITESDLSPERAFKNNQSDIQVRGSGKVVKILPDDTKGVRHQKFIIEIGSGLTLLIAHNIDIAPRINTLEAGDHIGFHGEYEWGAKGGVVHWTHHDPGRRHEGGWLKHDGKLYQ